MKSNGKQKAFHVKKKEQLLGYVFLAPSFIGVSIFVLIPFLDVIRRSFSEVMTTKFVGLKNYKLIFTNQAFYKAMSNTLHFIVICIPLLLIAL